VSKRYFSIRNQEASMSNDVLDTAKFVFDVIKDGLKVDGKTVSVLPVGKTMLDLQGWQGPVTFTEFRDQLSLIFQVPIIDLALTAQWMFNGEYIGNFKVTTDGTVNFPSTADISVSTDEAFRDADGVVQLPYALQVTFRNPTSGTQHSTITALARGDGGVMSTEH
jgi:hypothetical protein